MKRFFALGAGLLVVVTALSGCTSNRMASAGWETLIEYGSGLQNFTRVGDANWREQDGAIQADKRGEETGYLVSRSSYTDFVLYAEVWVNDEGNSGIFLRLSDRKKIGGANAYEVQINDKSSSGYATGAISRVAKVSPPVMAGGKWNSFEITAKGTHLTVRMNGVQTVNVSDRTFFHGPIALQYSGGIVKYRQLQIRPI